MPSGQYTVDDSGRGRGDTSFRACVIALLIFLLFCATIIIVLLVVKRDAGAGTAAEGGHGGSAAKLAGDEGEKEDRKSGTEPTTASSEERSAREGFVGAVGSPDSTSASPELSTTVPSRLSPDLLRPAENETLAGNFTSTERPLNDSDSTSTSTSTLAAPPLEERRSPEEGVDPAVTTPTERSSGLVEPPTIPTTPPPPVKPVPCESAECKRLGANMLAAMGLDAEPCKHFYEFACGGLRHNKYLLEPDYEEEAWQRLHDMVDSNDPTSPESFKMFQRLIQSCQTYDPVKDINTWKEAVNKEIKDLGGIAVEEAEFTKNFTRLFLGLLQYDRPFIFEVTLDINDKSPDRFAVKMFPASMMENHLYPEDNGALECQAKAAAKHQNMNDIYNDTLNCMNYGIGRTKAYEDAKEALLTLGILSATDEAEKLNQTLNDYVNFLVLNNEVLGDKATRRLELENRQPDLKTAKQLNEMFEAGLMVDWAAVIERLLGRALADDETVQVYSAGYFTDLDNATRPQQRQLHNAALVALATARHRDLVAEQRWRPRVFPTHCARLAARLLPDAAAALFLGSFSVTRRAQLEAAAGDLLFDLTNTALRELDDAPWLQHAAAKTLRADLEYKMEWIKDNRNISEHTRRVMDTRRLDAALEGYTIDEAGFIKNALTLMARNRERLYKRIDEEPINNIWTHFIHPYDTTGISLYSLNFFAIPLGAIAKPFYDPDYMRHLRLAGLGFSVAHQMAHHIDSLGIEFNTKSNNIIKLEYKEKIPRFHIWKTEVNIEYLNITGPGKHKIVLFRFAAPHLKDKEYFADKIAIQLAYKTYKKKQKTSDPILPYLPLTNDQSFFVFLAQKFCTKLDYFSQVLDFFESPYFPPETRVKHMIEDNAAFNNAFNCNVTHKTDFPFPYIYVPEDDVPGV